jgi:hypothetical protein
MFPLGSPARIPRVRILLGLVLSLVGISTLIPAPSNAQSVTAAGPASGANADIVKMLEAGLPESVIVNKIHEGASKWDTSVDAIIALKKAGATEAELNALTAASVVPVSAPASPNAPAVIQVLGGYLSNHNGDYTLFEPGSSPKDYLSNMLFHIVVIDGHAALRLPVRGDYLRKMYSHCYSTWGDLILEHDKVTYYPYGRINWAFILGKWKSDTMAPDPSLKPYTLAMPSIKPKEWDPKKVAIIDVHLTQRSIFSDDDFPYSFAWGEAFEVGHDMPSQEFLQALFRDYDGTMKQLLTAAGLTDPDHQLGPKAHFTPPTQAEIPAILVQLNREVARWRAAVAADRQARQQASGGSSFLALMNVMQGVTSMAQATSEGTTAAITGNTAGQMAAMQQQLAAQAQIAGALSGSPSAPAQPVAPSDPNAIQNAANQQVANLQAAQARAAAQQQAAQQQSGSGSIYKYTPPQPNPGGFVNPGPVAGAPPVDCVAMDLSKPCIPVAQYNAWQAAIDAAPIDIPPPSNCYNQMPKIVENDNFWQGPSPNVYLCPRAGYITTGYYAAPDAYMGQKIPCTVGKQEVFTWAAPNCPTISGSLNGGGGSSAGGIVSTGGGGTTFGGGPVAGGGGGGVPASGAGSEVPGVNSCIALTNNSDGTFNYQNTCNFAIRFYWTPRTPGPGQFAEQNGTLGPGQSGTSAFAPAGGGYDFYACPAGYLVLGPNKQAITGYVTNYYCVKP